MMSFNIQRSFARCQVILGRAEHVFEGGITMLTYECACPSSTEDATVMLTTFI